jgi:two-component system, OmpR family, sensor kinase
MREHWPYEFVVEHSLDALALHDEDLICRYASAGFIGLGVHPGRYVDRRLDELAHPADAAAAAGQLRALVDRTADVEAVQLVYRLRTDDGAYHPVSAVARLAEAADARYLVVATRPAIAHDSLRVAVDALLEETEQLRADAEAERWFLRAFAHETRTPLTTVVGSSHLLAERFDDLGPDVRRELLDSLTVNAQRLQQLVEQFSALEVPDTPGTHGQREAVDLHALATEVRAAIFHQPDRIIIEVPAPTVVPGVPRLLRAALYALLGNVATHTPADSPARVTVERADGVLAIGVADSGPGVPDRLKEEIFRPFRSHLVDPSSPTIGLGLHLVRRVAALHGGSAWCEDGPTGGATFWLIVPAGQDGDAAQPGEGRGRFAIG